MLHMSVGLLFITHNDVSAFTGVVRVVNRVSANTTVAAGIRLVPSAVVRLVPTAVVRATAVATVVRTPTTVATTIITAVGSIGSSFRVGTWRHSVASQVAVDQLTSPPKA